VYVVIGGAGGIGQMWSELMIDKHQAQMVWIGRREADDTLNAKLEALASKGPKPMYIAADATNRDQLKAAFEQVKQRFGQIHGVVNSALVFYTQALDELEEVGVRGCLQAKIDVSVNLIETLEGEPLDFLLFFSSIVALTKNPQQSHYAAGCQFKDAYALAMRQQWQAKGYRTPIKIINWGFWHQPNNLSFDGYQEYARLGIGMIEPAEGYAAIESLLASRFPQLGFMKTSKPILIEGMDVAQRIQCQQQRSGISLGNMMLRLSEKLAASPSVSTQPPMSENATSDHQKHENKEQGDYANS
jgi:polyketide synthase PksM